MNGIGCIDELRDHQIRCAVSRQLRQSPACTIASSAGAWDSGSVDLGSDPPAKSNSPAAHSACTIAISAWAWYSRVGDAGGDLLGAIEQLVVAHRPARSPPALAVGDQGRVMLAAISSAALKQLRLPTGLHDRHQRLGLGAWVGHAGGDLLGPIQQLLKRLAMAPTIATSASPWESGWVMLAAISSARSNSSRVPDRPARSPPAPRPGTTGGRCWWRSPRRDPTAPVAHRPARSPPAPRPGKPGSVRLLVYSSI